MPRRRAVQRPSRRRRAVGRAGLARRPASRRGSPRRGRRRSAPLPRRESTRQPRPRRRRGMRAVPPPRRAGRRRRRTLRSRVELGSSLERLADRRVAPAVLRRAVDQRQRLEVGLLVRLREPLDPRAQRLRLSGDALALVPLVRAPRGRGDQARGHRDHDCRDGAGTGAADGPAISSSMTRRSRS